MIHYFTGVQYLAEYIHNNQSVPIPVFACGLADGKAKWVSRTVWDGQLDGMITCPECRNSREFYDLWIAGTTK